MESYPQDGVPPLVTILFISWHFSSEAGKISHDACPMSLLYLSLGRFRLVTWRVPRSLGALTNTSGREVGEACVNATVMSTPTSPASPGFSLVLKKIHCWNSLAAVVILVPCLGPSSADGNICITKTLDKPQYPDSAPRSLTPKSRDGYLLSLQGQTEHKSWLS